MINEVGYQFHRLGQGNEFLAEAFGYSTGGPISADLRGSTSVSDPGVRDELMTVARLKLGGSPLVIYVEPWFALAYGSQNGADLYSMYMEEMRPLITDPEQQRFIDNAVGTLIFGPVAAGFDAVEGFIRVAEMATYGGAMVFDLFAYAVTGDSAFEQGAIAATEAVRAVQNIPTIIAELDEHAAAYRDAKMAEIFQAEADGNIVLAGSLRTELAVELATVLFGISKAGKLSKDGVEALYKAMGRKENLQSFAKVLDDVELDLSPEERLEVVRKLTSGEYQRFIDEHPDAYLQVEKQIDLLLDGLDDSAPEYWLERLRRGNEFNRSRENAYPHSEVYICKTSTCNEKTYYRLDSYNPATGEIVSRKWSQLASLKRESTWRAYINEISKKYPVGARIARVDSNNELLESGDTLCCSYVLEVPYQNAPIPQAVLDYARKESVVIREVPDVSQ